jgi:hypothetical protein
MFLSFEGLDCGVHGDESVHSKALAIETFSVLWYVQGVQVGHLPRGVALHLAPLLDSSALALEGLVPHGNKNNYKMPVKLFVYARNDSTAAVKNGFSRAHLELEKGVTAEQNLQVSGCQRTSVIAQGLQVPCSSR